MDSQLTRTVSVKQVSRAATCLPLELMQTVFEYLDTKSFYAARKVCKYWQFASTDAMPLARQLRKLPILPCVDPATSNPNELQELYEEAARSFMIGIKSERAWDQPGSLTKASKMGFPVNPKVTATRDGSRTVTLNGRTIALFDTSGRSPVCISQRQLNDLKETVGNGPWLKIQPNSYNELALSSDGSLLAVAQERTIQIYDLLAEPDSFTVNEYVSSATGHYICGLDFEQNDRVLRVRLSGKGAILYLGTPAELAEEGQKTTIEHWKSKKGLKHTFLDSSLLASQSTDDADQVARVSGLQLLQRFEDGYLFAGQRHGGGKSSYYVLGHVKTALPAGVLTVEPESVTILARLESFLSSWDYTLESPAEFGMGLWENMPSAHEHHPSYALTLDGCFLALAERDKKRIRPAPLTQLFVYRIPTEKQLQVKLAQKKAEKKGEWATSDSFLENLESRKMDDDSSSPRSGKQQSKYTVPRMPLCLTTLQGDVTDLVFNRVDGQTYSISGATVETTRTWLLQEV